MSLQGKTFGLLITGIFIVAGFVIMGEGVMIVWESYESSNWPTSTGKIITSRMHYEKDRSAKYTADISYVYTVNGLEHSSKQLRFGSYGNGASADARKLLNEFPSGKAVKVYYNPEDYAQATLEVGINPKNFLIVGFGLLFAFLGGIGFLVVLQSDRSSSGLEWLLGGKKFVYFIALNFIIAGLAVMHIGLRDIVEALASESWPTADGQVMFAMMGRHSNKNGATYSADISYDYILQGVTYSSSRVGFGDYSSSDSTHAGEILARYPVGSHVKIHYNPADPYRATLEMGNTFITYFIAFFGLLFTLIGGFVFWVARFNKGSFSVKAEFSALPSELPITPEENSIEVPQNFVDFLEKNSNKNFSDEIEKKKKAQ